MTDGPGAHTVPFSDLDVAEALRQQRQHLTLALGQPGRVGARGRARLPRHVLHPAPSQLLRHAGRRGLGSQLTERVQRTEQMRSLPALGQGAALLEAATEAAPPGSRSPMLTAKLKREGTYDPVGQLCRRPRAPRKVDELGNEPGVTVLHGHRQYG